MINCYNIMKDINQDNSTDSDPLQLTNFIGLEDIKKLYKQNCSTNIQIYGDFPTLRELLTIGSIYLETLKDWFFLSETKGANIAMPDLQSPHMLGYATLNLTYTQSVFFCIRIKLC